MSLEFTTLIQSFATILTLVRFIMGVYTKMSLEMTALIKSFPTVLTLVRFITSVYTKMSLKITIVTKSFFHSTDIGNIYLQCVYKYVYRDP